MTSSEKYLQTLTEARTRFVNLLAGIQANDLLKKVGKAPNSAGYLIRHIADVELLFAKNVFGGSDVQVHAKTVIAGKDTGEWTHLQELIDYQKHSYDVLKSIILMQKDEDWEQVIVTKEFGSKTKAEALGRIISHTAYHAGQLALVLKYGE